MIRLLLVDGSPAFARWARSVLGKAQISIRSVKTGREAVEEARAGRFDAALLELWSAGMNGIVTLEHLHEIDPHLPVVVMSGMGTDVTEGVALRAGAARYLAKPFSAATLLEAVRSAAESGRILRDKIESGEVTGRKGRILFADDHEEFRNATARGLRLRGFTVVEARDGMEAAILWGKGKFDAGLLDIHMPRMDGLAAARRILAGDTGAVILFVTGEANRREFREGHRISAGGCIQKPVDLTRLEHTLSFLIRGGRAAREEARRREAFQNLPAPLRAGFILRIRLRELQKKGEFRRAALCLLLTLVVSLPILAAMDAAHRTALMVRDTAGGLPPPREMYQEVVGYLHRDEEREIASARGAPGEGR